MATMPERMSVVETKIESIDKRTEATDAKVDRLLTWMDEERGARQQRALNSKKWAALVAGLGTIAGAASGLALKLIGG